MDSVAKELSVNSANLDDLSKRAQYLKRMYDFLVVKRKIIVSFPEFFPALKEISSQPSKAMWSAYRLRFSLFFCLVLLNPFLLFPVTGVSLFILTQVFIQKKIESPIKLRLL